MAFILTIDDGPSELAKTKLDYLNKLDLKAIWFCLGQHIEQRPELAIEIIRTGHIIANHSYSHPHFSEINFEEAHKEIARTEQVINNLYTQAKARRPVKLFRFPYGDQGDEKATKKEDTLTYKKQLQQCLNEKDFSPILNDIEFYSGYANHPSDFDWLWSYDIQEWAIGHENGLQLSIQEVRDNLQHYLNTHNKDLDQVILIHDHDYTNQYFSQLVSVMLKNYKFVLPSF